MPVDPSVNEVLDELARRVDQGIPQESTVDDHVFTILGIVLDDAARHAHAGEDIPEDVRARALKKLMVGGMRPVTSYQRVFNERILQTLETLVGLMRAETAVSHTLEPRFNRTNAAVATIDVAIDQVAELIRSLQGRLAAIEAAADTTESADPMGRRIDTQDLAVKVEVLEARMDRLAADDATARATPDAARAIVAGDETPATPSDTLAVDVDANAARLYADLEDAFRGSRADVRDLLEPYLTDVTAVSSPAPVLDIGCGRGEWLEILRDHEIPAYGFDLNALTVAECSERGLDARRGDGIAHIGDLGEGSLAAVTGFHVAEHLPFAELIALIEAASVALVGGGVLILETPNCTNLIVGASAFHLDPTHIRPLHPQLLEFLCRRSGFDDVDVRYLHPRKTTSLDEAASAQAGALPPGMLEELNWALYGPMDYAVVATKSPVG